ncbi:MAG: RNA polymerase-binding transcription factor DksA [Porticoccus sp.]|jgi:RNA polymerase-binding transcription factor DksA
MLETDRLLLNTQIEKRISVLENTLSDCHSISNKKRSQAGDSSAIFDLTINAFVDDKILLENKLELAQLATNLNWMQGDDAGVCALCACDIPLGRLQAVPSTRLCVACAGNKRE